MALTLEIPLPTGLSSVTAELFPFGSTSIANGAGGDSATEISGKPGIYSATIAETLSGWHDLIVKVSTTAFASYRVFCVDGQTCRATDGAEVSSVTGAVGSVTAGVTLAADSITSSAVAASAVTEIQSGLALATDLATLTAYVDTEVAAIKAKTDNLPADPADASDIAASFASIASTLATIAAYIDTEVAAIKAKTDNLPSSPASTSDVTAQSQVGAAAALIAYDAATGTDVSAVETKVDTIDGLVDQIIAEVVTSQSMPGQGAPPATLKLATAIMYLYKQFRNKKTQTNSEYKLFADDGTTVDQKSTVSDDGTTTTVGEMDTGA